MKVVSRKVTDAEKGMNSLVGGLRRGTRNSYASIRNKVDQSLAEVSKCLITVFDSESMDLQ